MLNTEKIFRIQIQRNFQQLSASMKCFSPNGVPLDQSITYPTKQSGYNTDEYSLPVLRLHKEWVGQEFSVRTVLGWRKFPNSFVLFTLITKLKL